jgi:hypothetical protein
MMNLFLWALLFTLTSGIFNFTWKLSSAARTFEGLDASLAQAAVVAVSEATHVECAPFFSRTVLENQTQSYFEEGLGKAFKATDWSFAYTYSGYQTIGLMGFRYPQIAEIRFVCDIAGLSTYHGKRTFKIVRGMAYGQ